MLHGADGTHHMAAWLAEVAHWVLFVTSTEQGIRDVTIRHIDDMMSTEQMVAVVLCAATITEIHKALDAMGCGSSFPGQ